MIFVLSDVYICISVQPTKKLVETTFTYLHGMPSCYHRNLLIDELPSKILCIVVVSRLYYGSYTAEKIDYFLLLVSRTP